MRNPPATQPAIMYFVLLSFSVGNSVGVLTMMGVDLAVVVSAKRVCTLEMLALRALDIVAREF